MGGLLTKLFLALTQRVNTSLPGMGFAVSDALAEPVARVILSGKTSGAVHMIGDKTNWRAVLAAYAVGVAGAVQVGRVAPVAPALQGELGISLFTLGWLISLITLASALFGLIAGYGVLRSGLRRSLVFGALIMGISAAIAAIVPAVPVMIAARIAEGVGYLIVVVAAPTLIAREAIAKDTPIALALWGTFFTLGLSIAALLGSSIAETSGWRAWFFSSAALVVVASAAVLALVQKDEQEDQAALSIRATVSRITKASWYLGAAFLGVTLLGLSILSLLPTFLIQVHSFSPARAGSLTGAVALASIIGSICYGALANRISDRAIAIAVTIALSASAFMAFSIAVGTFQIVIYVTIAVLMTGVLVAQTFAAVPKVAGAVEQIGPANGLVAQLGSVGALVGPPVLGALVTSVGWSAVPWVVAGFAVSFAFFLFLALGSENLPSATDVT